VFGLRHVGQITSLSSLIGTAGIKVQSLSPLELFSDIRSNRLAHPTRYHIALMFSIRMYPYMLDKSLVQRVVYTFIVSCFYILWSQNLLLLISRIIEVASSTSLSYVFSMYSQCILNVYKPSLSPRIANPRNYLHCYERTLKSIVWCLALLSRAPMLR